METSQAVVRQGSGGVNIGAITKRFMIITATSGTGRLRALFHLAGYRSDAPREGDIKVPQVNAERHRALWR